jgi:DNA-binding CsgD family transcriptional regulator
MVNTFGFSKREKEVVELLLEGKSNKQIAVALDISDGTVEFHLTNIYAKLGVSSRAEAIIRLSHLGKSPATVTSKEIERSASGTPEHYGESPVENARLNTENGSEQNLPILATPIMTTKANFLRKNQTPITLGIILVLASIIAISLYLLIPKTWNKYERECEYPDEFTVGQTIGRSNATGSSVHGQFGTTDGDPWSALPGYVTYKNISTPKIDQLYLKLRYSKNSPSSVPILIYLDDEKNPRAAIYPVDQNNWNQFNWTEPIFLGSIESGIHTIKFFADGQKYGVADLDKFILTAGSP